MNPTPTADEFPWAEPALREALRRNAVGVLRSRGVNVPADLPRPVVADLVRIVSLYWQDGRIVTREQFRIDPADEGLLFGRGVWESTKTDGGLPWLWDAHCGRMLRTAELLQIDLPAAKLPSAEQVRQFVRSLTNMEVTVRLNASAGPPGRPGTVWMSAALPPAPIASVRLQSCPLPVEKGQPYLTWKTFQYASRLQIGQRAGQAGFDTALLIDAEGHVLEASHANIFLRLEDGWVTPAADGGLLPGTVRQLLLEKSPHTIWERTVPRALLAEAREVFVTNSNVGIVPVTGIDDRTYEVGPETQELMRWMQGA